MDKAIETDAKLLLVTNSGSDLLAMVSPSSPLAAAAVRSIQDFLERHGDGSKRLVLMLSHGLQEAARQLGGAGRASQASLVLGLTALQGWVVEALDSELLWAMQIRCALPGPGGCSPLCSSPEEGTGLAGMLSSLLTTHMANKVGTRAVRHLVPLVVVSQEGCWREG
jgi:hypothetical protein